MEPESIPNNTLYLGLHILDTNKIPEIISAILSEVKSKFSEASTDALIEAINSEDFEKSPLYNNPWKYPSNKKWHVTTLFKKGKALNKAHPAYQEFSPAKRVEVAIRAIVYIPDKIITSVVFTDTPVENKFPHMTTLLGTFAAKHSNDVCQELFSEGKVLEKEYFSLTTRTEDELKQVEVTLFGQKTIAYVLALGSPILLESEMKAY